MKRSIEKMRKEYGEASLNEEDLKTDPVEQFQTWLEDAIQANVIEPNGMCLATVSPEGRPAARTVLLKHVDKDGFDFFTHYSSRKGKHLNHCPHASLTFWWKEIYRQICIEGEVKKVSRRESQAYFSKRPRGAQLAVLASSQSEPLAHREEVMEAYQRLERQFRGKSVPCPDKWGGYRLIPNRIEFWQGRKHRLHDRFVYIRADHEWVWTRLAP